MSNLTEISETVNKPKILVVEDEAIAAENIAGRLRQQGYDVVGIVDSGAEAIAVAIKACPDLVLMDVMLKGEMDGITAATEIYALLEIPIVYMTAYSDDGTLQRAKGAHPFGYLVKPFKPQELKATVEIALHSRQNRNEMKQALLQSELLREQAEVINKLKSDFMSMVSHEFRTPLTTINLSTDLLELQSINWTPEKKKARFERMRKAIQRMTDLLDDVIAVNKAESGKMEVNPSEFDLNQFCLELVEEMQLVAGENYQINLTCNCEDLIVNLDESLLLHIMTNLLSNAIKYSPQGGAINFDVEHTPNKVRFKVSDRGIGIPLADQERLFDSFFRAKNVGAIAGTGLGLTIIKTCVDVQGGEIFIDSNLGSGSIFTVILPIN